MRLARPGRVHPECCLQIGNLLQYFQAAGLFCPVSRPELIFFGVKALENITKRDWEKTVFDAEQKHFDALKLETGRRYSGICLSGGGVRSAVVCSGVLGHLARSGVLAKLNYISTVSGGGYAGASLTYWLSLRADELAKEADKDKYHSVKKQDSGKTEKNSIAQGADLAASIQNPSQEKQASGAMTDPAGGSQDKSLAATDPGDGPEPIDETISKKDKTNNNGEFEQFRSPYVTSLWNGACPFLETKRDTHFGKANKSFSRTYLKKNDAYIRHIRANINYLMPSGFRGLTAGAYVVVRSILLNIFIWTILAASVFWVLLLWGGRERDSAETGSGLKESLLNISKELPQDTFFWGLCWIALSAFFVVVVFIPLFSLGTAFKHIPGEGNGDSSSFWTSQFFGYKWRRFNERWNAKLIIIGLVCLFFGSLPWIADNLKTFADATAEISGVAEAAGKAGEHHEKKSAIPKPDGFGLGVLGTIIGIATSLFGLFRAKLGGVFGKFSVITLTVGSLLLIFSVALSAMVLAINATFVTMACLFAVALVLALLCNINDVSLGRFYRDKLMETFLPNEDRISSKPDAKLAQLVQPATQADTAILTEMKKVEMPLHLVNTNVVSWWTDDTRAKRRRGDNFVISARYCGSDITGWEKTENVAAGKLTLATAMAASGAALNPQGGFAGKGASTSPVVSLAMAMLSLRLGYWLRWKDGRTRPEGLTPWGDHINPGLWTVLKGLFAGLTGSKGREKPPGFIELTDGGHFENLGLYELVRRKCSLIIVCDGADDPETSYASFSSAIRRVREDFGAEIKFDIQINRNWRNRGRSGQKAGFEPSGPQDLVGRTIDNQYPRAADYADKGYFLASIDYNGVHPSRGFKDGKRQTRGHGESAYGLIIYLKSAMIQSLDLNTKGYKGQNPLFPYDPTSNQFFSPEQFEAYRDMGTKIAEQMDEDIGFSWRFDELMKNNSLLQRNPAFERVMGPETAP